MSLQPADSADAAVAESPSPEGAGAPQASSSNLGRQAARGVVWMTVQKWVTRLTGLATIAVLTRLLAPEDFGIVAAASAVVPVIYLFADLGFTTYITQTDTIDSRRLSTAFWFSIAAGTVLGGGLALVSPLIARALDQPLLADVLRAMCVSIAAVAVGSVPTALLKRRMRFRALSIQGTVAALLGQVVAVVTALAGWAAWALVAQLLFVQVLTTVFVWIAARWRPTWEFSPTDFRAMASFGLKLVAVDLIALTRNWAETAIVGLSLGVTGLGYLSIAQRLIQVVQDMSAAAITPVSVVVFAQIRSSRARLRRSYLRALGVSYAAVAPLLTVVAVAGASVIPLIFGPDWGPSVRVAQGLAVAAILTLGAAVDQALFYGLGKPGRWLAYAVVIESLTVATTAVAIRFGLSGVAIGFVGVAVLATVVRWVIIGRLLVTRTRVVATPLFRVAGCIVGSAAAGALVMHLTPTVPHLFRVALVGVVVLAVHVALLRVFAPGTVSDVLGQVPNALRAPLERLAGAPRRLLTTMRSRTVAAPVAPGREDGDAG
jgi:O-antigen/teichoic acid export membrane protein